MANDDSMPWEKYAIEKDEHGRRSNIADVNRVYHTAHIDIAAKIMRDGLIKSHPVYGKASSKISKMKVAWASANVWSKGSRYGNVRFEFDFSDLLKEKKAYWFQTVKDHENDICQILLTHKELNNSFHRYHPDRSNGPWIYDAKDKKHYRKSDIVLEFMIDGDLNLSKSNRISFTGHHPNMCSAYDSYKNCPDHKKNNGEDAIADLLKITIGSGLNLKKAKHLWPVSDHEKMIGFVFNDGLDLLLSDFIDIDHHGEIGVGKKCDKKLAYSLARAMMNAAAVNRDEEARIISGLFRSREDLAVALSINLIESLGLEKNCRTRICQRILGI